uniref:Uncharacterized protein n=1 Tax=Candidatus Kentrum sp. DK TaxID=2126562 RepID=A0A450RUN9_9GAMM|nr:MAG: hypothetical protein BECKDK2373C_GA0170839_100253 [Candidatus Kentron sp. DK]
MRLRATIEAKYATCRYISQTLLQLKKQQEGRLLLSVPVGIAMSLSDILQKVMFPMPALLQTPPGFVYLIPLISLFSVTKSKLRGIAIILHTAPETGRNVHGFSKVRATTPLDRAAQYCVRPSGARQERKVAGR